MATDEYKALTVVNLPYIEKRFDPGEIISRNDFEAYCEAAAKVHDDRTVQDGKATPPPEADEVISEMIEYGSISDDLDAPLHLDHLPVDPNKPSLARMVETAKALVAELEENGQDVPAKLREIAETSDRMITTVDSGISGDKNAG